MRQVAFGILWCCMAGKLMSQPAAPPATFEVASVKPSPPDAQGLMPVRYLPDGGMRVTGASLKNLISIAYNVRAFQISGGPNWIDTERFDIEARAVTSDPPKASEPRKTIERLKSLLADRFQLTLHPETREQPVYALVVAKGGPKLQESTDSASSIRRMGPGEIVGRAVGLWLLVLNLSSELDHRVIDKTGLTAKYSFDLKWTPSLSTQSTDPDGPSLFTALQEQLGLRLESEKGPVEFLVIDRAERPSKN